MKRIVLALYILLATASASAAVNGVYLGGELGSGSIYRPPFNPGVVTSGGSNGFAGRLFIGYQYSQYFSGEIGYTKFSTTNITYTQAPDPDNIFTAVGGVSSYAVDLVAKGTFTFENGYSLFGKFGGAYLNESGGSITLNNGQGSTSSTFNLQQGSVFPTFGLGVGYDINQNMTADLSWMRIQKIGSNGFQSTDLITLGLIYYLG